MSARANACVFPGQGSQRKGMGADLFNRHPELCAVADAVLGWSVKQLCLENPKGALRRTQYTQPALFVVNALEWLEHEGGEPAPAYLAGHSLGEYDALFAAGSFGFETGLRLVAKRGELMSRVEEGGMAAVLGLAVEQVRKVIEDQRAPVDVANLNLPTQLVLAGPTPALEGLMEPLERAGARKCILLNVSGAFHSRYMAPAAEEFAAYLEGFTFLPPKIPVIANATARPYPTGESFQSSAVAGLLVEQIRSSVRWSETMDFLRAQGVAELEELGPGTVLTKLWKRALEETPPAEAGAGASAGPRDRSCGSRLPQPPQGPPGLERARSATVETSARPLPPAREEGLGPGTAATPSVRAGIRAADLGNGDFRQTYGLGFAYVAGSSMPGTRPAAFVRSARREGLLAFLDPPEGVSLEADLAALAQDGEKAGSAKSFGVCFRQGSVDEQARLQAALAARVSCAEAVGYDRSTEDLIRFRFGGAGAPRRLLVEASTLDAACNFLSPPPEEIISGLETRGELSPEEARAARRGPTATDLCIVPSRDSAGLESMLPAILRLASGASPRAQVHVGAGGLGTPEAIAAAFFLGAAFVQTGAVSLPCAETGLPESLRRHLAALEPGDTTLTPEASGFALGAEARVVHRGSLLPPRARKLYEAYRFYDSLEALPATFLRKIEGSWFGRPLSEAWSSLQDRLPPGAATRDPKEKMALLFSEYLHQALRQTRDGTAGSQLHVPCDESLPAFNHRAAGLRLVDASERSLGGVARWLLEEAAAFLHRQARALEA